MAELLKLTLIVGKSKLDLSASSVRTNGDVTWPCQPSWDAAGAEGKAAEAGAGAKDPSGGIM